MANEQLKETMRRLYDAVNRGDYAAIEDIFSPGFVDHVSLGPGVPQNRDGVIQWFKETRQAFPDFRFEPEDISADGDRVWARGMLLGTQRGAFMGFPASGKSFHVEFWDEMRFDRNKIVEHWGMADFGGLMQQLGLAQMTGTQSH